MTQTTARPADRPFFTLTATLCLFAPLSARDIDLDPPAAGSFVQDWAHMIDAEDEAEIQAICDKLFQTRDTTICVVTISSMEAYAMFHVDDMSIETFAEKLFNQWGIGFLSLRGKKWNTGILLLVSEGDRKARIELGAGWEKTRDDLCRQIMDEQIITRFKDGDFSFGILSGVKALDDMARGKPLPSRPWSRNLKIAGGVGVGLLAFTVLSLFRSGRDGWGWVLWAALFGALGWLLFALARGRSHHRGSYYGGNYGGGFSGGGFSGGGFSGGGFSGGGGATGSW